MNKQCVNCPGRTDHDTADCKTFGPHSAAQIQIWREAFEEAEKSAGRSVEQDESGDYIDPTVFFGWFGFVTEFSGSSNKPRPEFLALAESCGARITGKPDGSEPIEVVFPIEAWRAFDAAMLAAAPAVKAEQVPTPEFIWVRLLEALAGDNGGAFTASTDDYREAKPALVQLIAAGFFHDDADSLDGDIWTVAAGEQGEAAARFASCSDAYAVLSDVLNRVFERDDQAYDRNAERLTAEALGTGSGINMAATSIDELFDETPSRPAAGSAVEEVEVVAYLHERSGAAATADNVRVVEEGSVSSGYTIRLMTVAQHERIVAALSAQQSAHVSVPRELLERLEHVTRQLAPHLQCHADLIALLNGGEA